MILESLGDVKPPHVPLKLVQQPEPALAPGEVLLRVKRCGVCHTELDEIEGRTPPPRLPVILGHQVVGTLESDGAVAPLSNTQEQVAPRRHDDAPETPKRATRRGGLDRVGVWALSVLPIGSGESLPGIQSHRARHRRRVRRVHEGPGGLCASHPRFDLRSRGCAVAVRGSGRLSRAEIMQLARWSIVRIDGIWRLKSSRVESRET